MQTREGTTKQAIDSAVEVDCHCHFYVRTHAVEINETFERYETSFGTQNSNKAQLTRIGKQATGAEATSAHSLAQTCS